MTARCDHCGKPERFNVLCAACEEATCETCGRVQCACCCKPTVCRWCGETYDEHLNWRPAKAPVPRMPCTGLKAFFYPREKP